MDSKIGRALGMLTETDEIRGLRTRFREFYLELAEQASPHLRGPEQAAWFDVLDAEHDNLRAATDWSLADGDAESAMRLSVALGWFWRVRGYAEEGRSRLETVLAAAPRAPAGLRQRALGWAAALDTDIGRARPLTEEALTIARTIGDRRAEAVVLMGLAELESFRYWGEGGSLDRAHALANDGLRIASEIGDKLLLADALGQQVLPWTSTSEVRERAEEALALRREVGDKRGIALSLQQLARQRWGDTENVAYFEQALAIMRELGDDPYVFQISHSAGHVLRDAGDLPAARSFLEEAAVASERLGRTGWPYILPYLARLCVKLGDIDAARTYAEQAATRDGRNIPLVALAVYQGDLDGALALATRSVAEKRDAGDAWGVWETAAGLAAVQFHRGDLESAVHSLEESVNAVNDAGLPYGHYNLFDLAGVLTVKGDYDRARSCLREADACWREAATVSFPTEAIGYGLRLLGDVARAEGQLEEAFAHYREVLTELRGKGWRPLVAICLESMAGLAAAQGDQERSATLYGCADRLRELMGMRVRTPYGPFLWWDAESAERHDDTVADVKRSLGDERFDTAWLAGRAMALDDAIAYALREPA